MTVGPWRIALLGSALYAGVPSCASAPDPALAFLVATQPLPDSLDVGRPHSVRVRRVARTPEERRALEAAEHTEPPRDSVLAAMHRYRYRDSVPTAPPLWWARMIDGVRWPYAITDAAVRYYLALGRDFRQGNFREVHGLRISSSSFRYIATTQRQAEVTLQARTFRDVYVVHLELLWTHFCGDLCSLNITAERTVIVSRAGEVLLITGDDTAHGYRS